MIFFLCKTEKSCALPTRACWHNDVTLGDVTLGIVTLGDETLGGTLGDVNMMLCF